jgi:hypothetical protein
MPHHHCTAHNTAVRLYDYTTNTPQHYIHVHTHTHTVPWDHDVDICVVVANRPGALGRDLTIGNYWDRLMLFNRWQTRFKMKKCHWNSYQNQCDTAFKVHPRGAKMDGKLWVKGTKVDIRK